LIDMTIKRRWPWPWHSCCIISYYKLDIAHCFTMEVFNVQSEAHDTRARTSSWK